MLRFKNISFRNISFKNKMLLTTLLVILLSGMGVTLMNQWILLPSLTSQLKQRGLGIAQSIAERSRSYVLTEYIPGLTSLIFDSAQIPERRPFINYIFIVDKKQNIISHTFTTSFAEELRKANIIPAGQSHSMKLLNVRGKSAYDIAVPILEGIYHIGTVHVGLSKKHIDHLISKLTTIFFGILLAIIIIGFLMSHFLSKYITRPVSQLTQAVDEISRGNLDIKPNFGSHIRCWEISNCGQVNCPAYENEELPCWHIDGTVCPEDSHNGTTKKEDSGGGYIPYTKRAGDEKAQTTDRFGNWYFDGRLLQVHPAGQYPEKLKNCEKCIVYAKRVGDEIVQLAESFTNMTCRLKAYESELKESEEKYRRLFDSTPNSIFHLEQGTSRILDVNERATGVYGYEKDELIGESFMDLSAYQYPEGVLCFKKDKPSTGSSEYLKVKHFKKDGTPFYVNVYAIQTKGRGYGIVAVTVDITESLAKESQLIQASKMSTLGKMASSVAHELNQPLSAMQIGADFISNVVEHEGKGSEDLPLVTQHMKEQIDRAVRIINHLREFGRKADIKKEKVYINQSIEGAFTLLSQQLKLRLIKVVLDLNDDLPPIMGDMNKLEQIFLNLVINARNAMEEKKEQFVERETQNILTVKSFQEDGQVVVTITDTGIGIPDNMKDEIFEPFFTTRQVGKGTGLGLSISYGIVKDYGGTIEVESEVGKGTTFKLIFPSCKEDQNGISG